MISNFHGGGKDSSLSNYQWHIITVWLHTPVNLQFPWSTTLSKKLKIQNPEMSRRQRLFSTKFNVSTPIRTYPGKVENMQTLFGDWASNSTQRFGHRIHLCSRDIRHYPTVDFSFNQPVDVFLPLGTRSLVEAIPIRLEAKGHY